MSDDIQNRDLVMLADGIDSPYAEVDHTMVGEAMRRPNGRIMVFFKQISNIADFAPHELKKVSLSGDQLLERLGGDQ